MGNTLADQLALGPNILTAHEAVNFHELTHVNWRWLHQMFPQVPVKELKKIVQTCKSCQPFLRVPPLQPQGVNPWGLRPNAIWQTDVTHFATFGKLYAFMSIDTYSRACWAMPHSGERAKHAQSHFLQCFATLGLPHQIKMDNGPCFASTALAGFFERWGIKHTTGIPYNLQGQAIVERNHQYLKEQLQKQKGGVSPHLQLAEALFTINILNF